MAQLAGNRAYQWYLRCAQAGQIQLPEYEYDDDEPILYYGEVFCRVPNCSKANKKYTATNNLRSHIITHDGYEFGTRNLGGRAKQEDIDEAVAWYRGLWADAGDVEETGAAGPSTGNALPPLPVKKDGSIHVTNMRKAVKDKGHAVPCGSCESRNACCKDINVCEHFVLFDCGDLAPDPAAGQQGENMGETA